jgi:hypothetical protein
MAESDSERTRAEYTLEEIIAQAEKAVTEAQQRLKAMRNLRENLAQERLDRQPKKN